MATPPDPRYRLTLPRLPYHPLRKPSGSPLGSAPDPAGGAYCAPNPLAGFKGPTSKGMEGRVEREGRGKRRGKGRGGRDIEREERGGMGKRREERKEKRGEEGGRGRKGKEGREGCPPPLSEILHTPLANAVKELMLR